MTQKLTLLIPGPPTLGKLTLLIPPTLEKLTLLIRVPLQVTARVRLPLLKGHWEGQGRMTFTGEIFSEALGPNSHNLIISILVPLEALNVDAPAGTQSCRSLPCRHSKLQVAAPGGTQSCRSLPWGHSRSPPLGAFKFKVAAPGGIQSSRSLQE